jgi:hypothetical protein
MTGSIPSFAPVIEDDWFTAAPTSTTAVAIGEIWRGIWRTNAVQAITAAAEGLGKPLPGLLEAVSAIDLRERLNPRLFARLAALTEAMQRGDGYAVYDIVQAWCSDPPSTWTSDHISIESIAMHNWESDLLAEVRGTQLNNVARLTLYPLLETDLTPFQRAVQEAMDRIAEVDPAMDAEIQEHVSLIKLFWGPGVEGFSSPKAFGAIWLQVPQPGLEMLWFLEHLVHECSHLHLNALLSLDPLLHNPHELHQAPIRPDPRPLFQVLHGTFVLARNCRVHRRLIRQWPDQGLEPALREFEAQLTRGISVLQSHMQPTLRGQKLLESLQLELQN